MAVFRLEESSGEEVSFPGASRSRRRRRGSVGPSPAGSRGGGAPLNREVCRFSGASYQIADVSLSLRVRAANAGTSHNRNAQLGSFSQGQPPTSCFASASGGTGAPCGGSQCAQQLLPTGPYSRGSQAPAMLCRLQSGRGANSVHLHGSTLPRFPARTSCVSSAETFPSLKFTP